MATEQARALLRHTVGDPLHAYWAVNLIRPAHAGTGWRPGILTIDELENTAAAMVHESTAVATDQQRRRDCHGGTRTR